MPAPGVIIETLWRVPTSTVNTRKKQFTRVGESAGADIVDSDSDYDPRSGDHASKRVKKMPREQEVWWPAIVLDMHPSCESSGGGKVTYTKDFHSHGVHAAADMTVFKGETFNVELALAQPGVGGDLLKVLHHLRGDGTRRDSVRWRVFQVPKSGRKNIALPADLQFEDHVTQKLSQLHERLAKIEAKLSQSALPADALQGTAALCNHSDGVVLQGTVFSAKPDVVVRLESYGMQKLVSFLMGKVRLPSNVDSACTSDMGEDTGTGVVRSASFTVPEAFCATLREFQQLTTWLTRDKDGEKRARISVYPSDKALLFPAYDQTFRFMFQDYGEFCDACAVPMTKRHVFLWHKQTSGRESHSGALWVLCSCMTEPVETVLIQVENRSRNKFE